MKKDKYNIAIVGATGLVGETLIDILVERKFPVGEVALLASERSAGKRLCDLPLSPPNILAALDD